MKILLSFLFIFTVFTGYSQTVTTMRIGDLRLGMSSQEVSRIIGKNIKFPDEDVYEKEVTIIHENVTYKLIFMEGPVEADGYEYTDYKIYSIKTTSTNPKTLSQMGVGNSLDDLWNAYKNYTISIYKQWDNKANTYSNSLRVFELKDTEASTILLFTIQNNKVISIIVALDEGCC